MTDEAIVLNETIHQSTRLRIMTLLVMQPETDRLAYGFIQQTLDLTGGNLTIHLRESSKTPTISLSRRSSWGPSRAHGCRRPRQAAAPLSTTWQTWRER